MVGDLFLLLRDILAHGRIGTLSVSRRKSGRRIFFDREGAYVVQAPAPRKIAIAPALEAVPGLADSIEEVMREARATDRTLPEILLSRGLVDERAYEALAAVQVREDVLALAESCRGYFNFREGDVPDELLAAPAEAGPACAPREELAAALEVRRKEQAEIARSIPSQQEVFVVVDPPRARGGREGIGQLVEFSTAALIDGYRTVREILDRSPFFAHDVLRAMAAMLARGAVKKTRLPELAGIPIHRLTPERAREVLPIYRRAVRHAYDENEVRLGLAQALDAAGQKAQAVAQYCAVGDAAARKARYEEAIVVYERARELDPESGQVRARVRAARLAAAQVAVARHDAAAAEKHLRQALRSRPDDLELYIRLVAAVGASGSPRKFGEIADAAAARSRQTGDPQLALAVIDAIARILPDDPSWRTRRANLLLDLGRREEAIQEMFALAGALRERGQARKAARVVEKLMRLAGDREDVRRAAREVRRRLPRRGRGPSARRARASIARTAGAILLAAILYQGASYWVFARFEREVARAEAATGTPATIAQADAAARTARAIAGFYRNFRSRWPLSIWSAAAGRRIAATEDQAEKAEALRDELRGASFARARKLRDLGDLAGARAAFQAMIDARIGDEWEGEARAALDGILAYEAHAQELAAEVNAAEAAGHLEEAFRAARRLLDAYPFSEAAGSVLLPVEVDTDPPGAVISVEGVVEGRAPRRLRIHPRHPVHLSAVLEGFRPGRAKIGNLGTPRIVIRLDRAPIWRVELPGGGARSPVASGDSVYTAGARGIVYAVTAATGRLRWTFRPGTIAEIRAGPIEAGATVCIATNEGRIEVLDRDTGGRIASIPLGGIVASRLVSVIGGRAIALATRDGWARAYELRGREPLWSRPLRLAHRDGIARVGKWIALAAEPAQLVFLSESQGVPYWTHDLGARPVAGPLADRGSVLCATEDGRIHCLAPRGKAIRWQARAGAAPGAFCLAGGALWYAGRDGRLHALSIEDGRERAARDATPVPAWIAPGPGGSLLIDRGAGRLAAIDPASGRTLWRFAGEGPLGGPPIAQGPLVVAATQKVLYGLRVERPGG